MFVGFEVQGIRYEAPIGSTEYGPAKVPKYNNRYRFHFQTYDTFDVICIANAESTHRLHTAQQRSFHAFDTILRSPGSKIVLKGTTKCLMTRIKFLWVIAPLFVVCAEHGVAKPFEA